jgi:lysozyme
MRLRPTQASSASPRRSSDGVDLNPAGDGTLGWASSGKGFAILKATQGTSYTDSDFAENWAALKSAGVVRGAYHFFDATVSGVDQANYFLQVVGTIEPGDLPPTLDIECPVSRATATAWATATPGRRPRRRSRRR